jgi:zinc transporter ZupT
VRSFKLKTFLFGVALNLAIAAALLAITRRWPHRVEVLCVAVAAGLVIAVACAVIGGRRKGPAS